MCRYVILYCNHYITGAADITTSIISIDGSCAIIRGIITSCIIIILIMHISHRTSRL